MKIGFNSNIPTLFVGSSAGVGTTGNVGIGTTSPSQKLEVNGRIVNGGSDFILGTLDGRPQKTKTANRALVHDGWQFGNDDLVINYDGDFEDGVFVGGPKLVVDGNLGIGVTNPTNRLEVCGTIVSREWIVDPMPWCDFKLKPGYKRMTAEEKLTYILTYGHLPEIDPGAEIETSGLKVAKNMRGMISNIEDNTMDIIDLRKENETLKKELEELKKQVQLIIEAKK